MNESILINHTLRCIVCMKGRHTVTLYYRPQNFPLISQFNLPPPFLAISCTGQNKLDTVVPFRSVLKSQSTGYFVKQ